MNLVLDLIKYLNKRCACDVYPPFIETYEQQIQKFFEEEVYMQ